MPKTYSFHDLQVWQKAMDLVEAIYLVTKRFPREEQFGLTSQLRRASVSIASNIGEGKRRQRDPAYLHHLDIALGSQGEVEVQLEIARRTGLLPLEEHDQLHAMTVEVGRMLSGLIASMQPEQAGGRTANG
jgi:four helix bundle protein